MTPGERERLQYLISQRISNLAIPIKNAVQVRQAYQAAVNTLDKQTYSLDYIASHKADELNTYRSKITDPRAEFDNGLNELESLLKELHGELDLANPAWQNAIGLIQAGVSDIETINKINMSFAGDQASLKALRDIYHKAGVQFGNLDDLSYEVEPTLKEIRSLANVAFLPNKNLNSLARRIGDLARLEGVKNFDTMPDEPTIQDVIRERIGM